MLAAEMADDASALELAQLHLDSKPHRTGVVAFAGDSRLVGTLRRSSAK